MHKLLDTRSALVALTTLALFIAALFVKGVTHDLFIEAGVFLVSLKLIVMMHENRSAADRMDKKLDDILAQLSARGRRPE
jgi:hypothetical protein